MILQKKEELANRQLRLTITVERDAWGEGPERRLSGGQGPVPGGGLRRGQGSP